METVIRMPESLQGLKWLTDVEDEIRVAGISVAAASDTAAVRVARFVTCSFAPVVTPVATVTEQCDAAGSASEAAVSVNVAVRAPEFEIPVVNVVDPHPVSVGVARDEKANVGKTRAIESPMASATLSSNVKTIDVTVGSSADVYGFESTIAL